MGCSRQLTHRPPSPLPSSGRFIWMPSHFDLVLLSAVAGMVVPVHVLEQVLVSDINSSLRRLMEDISEDNWMYDPIDLGQGNLHGR